MLNRYCRFPGLMRLVAGLVVLLSQSVGVQAGNMVMIGDFSSENLQGWEAKSFAGQTAYSFASVDGNIMLKAESNQSASGLTRKIKVDLTRTPYLNWSWRVDSVLSARNETSKDGDDYPARVYVLVSGGIAFWKTRALNYVWSSSMPKGASWPNAFLSNARMLVVRSGPAETGQVVFEKRNVLEDLKTYLHLDADQIDGVAIMTDTDNGGGHVTAYYGDIYCTAQ
ncbi:DUF3047 domain-containing protein [Desulfoplanes formicivorans]|uniref:DUF3047 domain-containing protein n=1 Tax=Desulfoplanes formicivorans TaxID=1592317 RepID=A0A194AKB4_9BACT|nr:DUF3047 domain-containing protein [Desulfoplanes formicivorans]GAU09154.1 hypothetical protein DPF_1874 [Desulfoplanes formicivorans]